MSRKKGQAEAQRQNFSMHPDLIKTLVTTTNSVNSERASDIILDRGLRVTYSKIAAALLWHLKSEYLTADGQITDKLRLLLAEYEASDYEKTDAPDADAVMEERRQRASRLLPTTRPFKGLINSTRPPSPYPHSQSELTTNPQDIQKEIQEDDDETSIPQI